MDQEDVLFITLDSCRFDTFNHAYTNNLIPNLKSVGTLHKAQAPSHFTYGSHSAFWMGFTPGVAKSTKALLNPKAGKLFRMSHAGLANSMQDCFVLYGKNIIEGFKNKGYLTLGTGAVEWFNPATPTGFVLGSDFNQFYFSGNTWNLESQIDWINKNLKDKAKSQNVFCFINIGETHVPYWHEGAAWERWPSPCVPFGGETCNADECSRKQLLCLEWTDRKLSGLLKLFSNSTIVVCSDHGDCWGEDGLWEHGISHEKTLTVPLIIRTKGQDLGLDTSFTSPNRSRSVRARLKQWLQIQS